MPGPSPSESLWIVVPTYNERPNISTLLGELRAKLPHCQVLVVDDNSPDGTAARVAELAEDDPAIHLLERPGKEGLGPAYRAGFRRALAGGATRVGQMDADGSHRVGDLVKLVAQDADLVLGSRYVPGGDTPGWSPSRRLLSRLGGAYCRLALGWDITDPTGGFKVWRAELLGKVLDEDQSATGYLVQVELTWLAHRLGGVLVEVPICFGERAGGESKMSTGIALEALWKIPKLRLKETSGSR